MAALTLLASPAAQLTEKIARLRADARNTDCVSCRSADLRDCQAGPARCCDACDHPMSADDVASRAEELLAALDKLALEVVP